jgi:hypothetical protein
MRLALLALILSLCGIPAAAGPMLAPGQKLFVIRTEHFDLIYPTASEHSALRLSLVAEEVYAEVSSKLRQSLPSRVPVVITPDIGVFNGFANPFPYMHIVLYDTPLDPGWTAFTDNFRSLFLHELTHAVSLQIKAPWASFLSGIFGSWAAPALLNAPEFMVEGAAVSFESADGIGGRANDPLVGQRLRQDILENEFKSPLEAEGVYDEYPGASIYYEYGGLFNDWLQRSYGREAYARLWKAMGGLIWSASLDLYDQGFFRAFREVYGLPFTAAWARFRQSLAILGVLDPPEPLTGSAPASIASLAGGGDSLFWIDARSSKAWRMEAATGRLEALFDAGAGDRIADASADGRRLLVTRVLGLPDGRNRVESLVWDRATRRFEGGSEVTDLREPRFFRDGLVGILPKLHDTDLVYISNGQTTILLPGSEEIMYSSPTPLESSTLALIVIVGGKRNIGLLDVDSGRLRLLRPRGETGALDYVRQLSASGGRLWFNYDSDDRMYKLGSFDGQRLLLETRDWSGGVLMPRESGGRVYYLGRFSAGDRLCRYPGEASALGLPEGGGKELGLDFEDFDPGEAARADWEARARAAAITSIEAYRPLDYMKPFGMWLLYPDLATLDRSARVLSLFYLQDPIEANSLLLGAGYDSAFPFAEASLAWSNVQTPLRLDLSLADHLAYGSSGPPERQSSASLQASLALPLFPDPRRAILGLGASLLDRAEGSSGSPYAWAYRGPGLAASAWLGALGRLPGVAADSSRGLDLVSYHDLDLASGLYKSEAQVVLAIERPSLRLELWGAWASGDILSLDSRSTVFAADRRPAYAEYQDSRVGVARYLAEGELSWRLADQAIHSRVLDLYLNRLLVDLGYRAAWFEAYYLESGFARLSMDLAAGLGAAGGLGLRAFAEAFARLSEAAPEGVWGWRLGIQTQVGRGPR